MSFYAWERGTITLPSSAVAPLKKQLRDTANRHHDQLLVECKAWWARNKTSSWNKYKRALMDSRELSSDAHDALGALRWHLEPQGKAPRQIQAADLSQIAPRYTNRDNAFTLGGEGTIAFDGRRVLWNVPENNHAPEHARDHVLALVLFGALRRLNWTRGSGGQIVGNDEYNRLSDDAGGAGNYVVESYPPRVPTRVGR